MSHYFLAVPLPDDLKEYLHEISKSLRERLNYGYWTGQEDYHITLYFLGAVDPERLEELKERVHKKTKDMQATHLKLKGFGTFGKKDEPRVLWMGIYSDKYLNELQSIVTSSVVECGFEAEKRPYLPHITIAKKWRGKTRVDPDEWDSIIPIFEPLSWDTKEFHLFQVKPDQNPRYVPVERYSLV